MPEKSRKNIIFFSLLFFFLILFNFALVVEPNFAQKELEVEYPEIYGLKLKTTATPLPDYVKYIFNFFIAIIGLIGFGALIVGGMRYLTSAGGPEKRKDAKKQIKSAFLGMILLLFSYLILTTINPQLVVFQLGIKPTPPAPLPQIPISPVPTADLLGRIKELAEKVKEIVDLLQETALEIQSLTENCDCQTTQPICLCQDYYGSCEGTSCYSAQDSQPCPDSQEIKRNQKTIIGLMDEILYYKNRALAEREDLREDLEKVIKKKIKWYEDKIASEKKVLEQLEEEPAKEWQKKIIAALEEEKGWLEEEKKYKEDLMAKLQELAETIGKIKEPATAISHLPDQCLSKVGEICQPSCRGGCHDEPGCFPAGCSGGNPCPTGEIQGQVDIINSLWQEIKKIADEIIDIVNKIPKIKEREIVL